MVRSVRIAAVVMGLAWPGLIEAQPSPPATAAPRTRYVTVREEGKQPQRCQLLRSWREPNGVAAFQVKSVSTGEVMTIVGSGPPSTAGDPRSMSTRIFHWGSDNKPPAGSPQPPPLASAAVPSVPPTPQTPQAAPLPLRQAPVATAARPSAPMAPRPQISPLPLRQAPTGLMARPSVPPASQVPQAQPLPARPAPAALTAQQPYVMPMQQGQAARNDRQGLLTARQANTVPAPTPVRPPASQPFVVPSAASTNRPLPAPPPPANPIPHVNPAPTTSVAAPPRPAPATGVGQASHYGQLPSAPPQPRLVPSASNVVVNQPCNCNSQPCNTCTPCNECCQPCNTCKPCNECCQPSCVTCTPPLRQSFLSRLLKPRTPCNEVVCQEVACQPAPTPPVKPAPVVTAAPKPVPLAVAKLPSEPAKPRDFRESWGNVEPWKPTEATKRLAPKPVPMEISQQPDPLKAPALYRDLAMDSRPANSKIPNEPQPMAASNRKHPLLEALRPAERKRPVNVPATVIVAAPPPAAPPMTVLAPPTTPPVPAPPPTTPPVPAPPPPRMMARAIELPANEPNAFTTPQERPVMKASVPRQPTAPPPDGVPQGPLPRPPMPFPLMPPRPPMPPPLVDTGVPEGMGNAFTLTGTRRPIPADFGGTPQEGNGFSNGFNQMMSQAAPNGVYPGAYGYPRAPMPNAMAMAGRMPVGVNPYLSVPPSPMAAAPIAATRANGVPHLLATLKDSLYPSQREWAVEQLSSLNWHKEPQVVDNLMKAAQEDPAATVRVACVHALAQMKVRTSAATTVVQKLKADRDPRVRQEAQQALATLGVSGSSTDSAIQQASHR